MEHVQSKNQKIYDIPKSILKQSLDYTILNEPGIISFGFNLSEIIFYMIFKNRGWGVQRLPMNRYNSISRIVMDSIKHEYNINSSSLVGKGCPDFLLMNTKEKKYMFVEVKLTEKKLNPNQVKWLEKYEYDLYIARFSPIEEECPNKRNMGGF